MLKNKFSFSHFDEYQIFNIISTKKTQSINPFTAYNFISRIAEGLQIPQQEAQVLNRIIFAEQVHGKDVHVCKQGDEGSIKLGVDALISNVSNHILAIYSSDCVPLLLFDPKNRVVGAVHAGYKGLSQGIINNCLKHFHQVFNSNMSDILIGIAPFINVCCYEVKEDMFGFLQNLD
ncbi:MAG: polyphenol oxidase family protein [Tolypothrix carrinoi HA7290-LM1]|jgi:YfiH family protein|nr:polyphenol oxidase family protein [Tolypothrix carrinoi HA7290-LM1]